MDGNHPQFDKLCHKDMLGDLFDLIWSLPAANRTIFCWLMVCLFGVSLCEEETKMGPENIALVFGPNLMRFSANPTPTESMKVQIEFVLYIEIIINTLPFLRCSKIRQSSPSSPESSSATPATSSLLLKLKKRKKTKTN